MQVVEDNLSLIYWFLKFGKGHKKHELLVNICYASPLELNRLNQHKNRVEDFPLSWETLQPSLCTNAFKGAI
jgi:hypothetical protein